MTRIEQDVDELLRQYHSDTSPEAKKKNSRALADKITSIKAGVYTDEAARALKRLEHEVRPDRTVHPPVGTVSEAEAAAAAAGVSLSPETRPSPVVTPPAPAAPATPGVTRTQRPK